MSQVYICDKCGVILHSDNNEPALVMKYFYGESTWSKASCFDLCDSCRKDFEQWIGKEVIKKSGEPK